MLSPSRSYDADRKTILSHNWYGYHSYEDALLLLDRLYTDYQVTFGALFYEKIYDKI